MTIIFFDPLGDDYVITIACAVVGLIILVVVSIYRGNSNTYPYGYSNKKTWKFWNSDRSRNASKGGASAQSPKTAKYSQQGVEYGNPSQGYQSLYPDQNQPYPKHPVQEPRVIQEPNKQISDNELLLQILAELRQIRERLGMLQLGQSDKPTGNPFSAAQTAASFRQTESPLKSFCRLYNEALDDQNRRQEFRRIYNTIRIGTANVLERTTNSKIAPEFQEANNGDYYAVEIEDRGQRYHAVVPKFDLAFQDSSYGPGAMGEVFDCRNYTSGVRYRQVRVIAPAVFDYKGDQWVFKSQGALELIQ